MKLKESLKDWQIAKLMFDDNQKEHCKIVRILRKSGVITETLCEGYYIMETAIDQKNGNCGWVVFDEILDKD